MIDKNPVAFITGVTGQDGAHLADLLLRKGYTVHGGYRRGVNKIWRLDYLGITDQINLIEYQLNEPQYIIEVLQNIKPDEIYNLAGESFVADSFRYPGLTLNANTNGTLNLLEAVRLVTPNSRVFFASSSETFGLNPKAGMINELSQQYPNNPYAISKQAADHFVKIYRERYGLFVCSGILFNHEGPLRGGQFVSRKITFNIARLKLKYGMPLELGNLNAARDWGAAKDYVEAMRLMLAVDKPQDFVIATGKLSNVREFLKLSSLSAGFDPVFEGQNESEVCIDKPSGKIISKISKKFYRPFDTPSLTGDPTKIVAETGWERKISFERMIDEMVSADIGRCKDGITDV